MKKYEVTIEGGNVYWRVNGQLHRDEGPAIECADGTKYWYKNNKFHREDGPAIEWADGDKAWYKSGEYHREDGPAVECADGSKYWYIEDKELTEAQFAARQRTPATRESKRIMVEGVEYMLSESDIVTINNILKKHNETNQN